MINKDENLYIKGITNYLNGINETLKILKKSAQHTDDRKDLSRKVTLG